MYMQCLQGGGSSKSGKSLKGVSKKSIFASPDTIQGKVSITKLEICYLKNLAKLWRVTSENKGKQAKGKNMMKKRQNRKKRYKENRTWTYAMITSCSQTTGQCFPWTMNNRKLTDIKHFFLPFMLFEACGAVFIMNSKINLRKLAWGSISVISHHFPVYSPSGSTANRCMRPSFSSLLSLKFFSLFFWC